MSAFVASNPRADRAYRLPLTHIAGVRMTPRPLGDTVIPINCGRETSLTVRHKALRQHHRPFLKNCYGTYRSHSPNNFLFRREKSQYNVSRRLLVAYKLLEIHYPTRRIMNAHAGHTCKQTYQPPYREKLSVRCNFRYEMRLWFMRVVLQRSSSRLLDQQRRQQPRCRERNENLESIRNAAVISASRKRAICG